MAIAIWRESFRPFEECYSRFTAQKALACIPFIGELFSAREEMKLTRLLMGGNAPQRTVELIRERNDYRVTRAVARALLLFLATVLFCESFLLAGVLGSIAGLDVSYVTNFSVDDNRLVDWLLLPPQQEEGQA